ncbi:MAG: hypothetical protein ACOX9C_02525 [Kiritimatiellia bacterium]
MKTLLAALAIVCANAGVANTLTWNGGNGGAWDDTTQNWLAESSTPTAWVPGSTARFRDVANVVVSGAKSVAGITVENDVVGTTTLSGDALGGLASVSLTKASLRIQNDVTNAADITLAADIPLKENATAAAFITTEPKLLYPGRKLADVAQIKNARQWSGNGNSTASGNVAPLRMVQGADTLAFQFGQDCSWRHFIVRIELSDSPDGILGRALYSRGAHASHSPYDGNYDDWDEVSKLQDAFEATLMEVETPAAGEMRSAVSALSVDFHADPAARQLEFAGELRTFVNETNVFKGALTQTAGGCFVFARPNEQLWWSDAESKATVHVKGALTIRRIGTLPRAVPYSTRVFDGGTLVYRLSNDDWANGVAGAAPAIVEQGGVLQVETKNSIGRAKPVDLQGGTLDMIDNGADTYGNSLEQLTLRDGALTTGTFLGLGRAYEFWGARKGVMGNVTVVGSQASRIESGYVRLGCDQTYVNADCTGASFNVADVTGDSAADLVVAAPIKVNPRIVQANSGYTNVCVVKTGAGTMDFQGANTFWGLMRLQQGVLRISGDGVISPNAWLLLEGGALDLSQSNGGIIASNMVLCADARIMPGSKSCAFPDSSEMAWNPDAVLTLDGDLGAKALRFGTDANGLTAEQLARIKLPNSTAQAWLSAEGYLRIGKASTLILLK